MNETTSPVELSVTESWALARGAPVGRLGVIVGDHPEVFPVNFIVDHSTVVIRTAAGTKLAAALDQPVALEVDGYDASSRSAWSVMIRGVAREVRQLHDVLDVLELPLETWHSSPKPRLLRIEPDVVTGRRFTRAVPSPRSRSPRAAHE